MPALNDDVSPVQADNLSAGAKSRRLILDTAAELFSTQGYAATGLRQIADRVGIRTASVYYHFASKERILEAIMKVGIETTVRATTQAVDALPEGATPRDRIEAAVRGHLHALHHNPHYTSVEIKFQGQLPAEVIAVVQPLRDQYSRYWRELLVEAQCTGWLKRHLRISILRPLILGTLNRTMTWFDPSLGPVDGLVVTTNELFAGLWEPAPPAGARE
jgi:AcrR family transcriptional regulator